jgi:hypothetical protein
MGRRRREQERRRKARQERMAQHGRETGSSAEKCWLTPAARVTRCSDRSCAAPNVMPGQDLVIRYNADGSVLILCVHCADRQGIKYVPSRRWDERRRKQAARSERVKKRGTREPSKDERPLRNTGKSSRTPWRTQGPASAVTSRVDPAIKRKAS